MIIGRLYVFSGEMSIQILCLSFIGLFVFLLLSCKSSLPGPQGAGWISDLGPIQWLSHIRHPYRCPWSQALETQGHLGSWRSSLGPPSAVCRGSLPCLPPTDCACRAGVTRGAVDGRLTVLTWRRGRVLHESEVSCGPRKWGLSWALQTAVAEFRR